MPRSNEFDLKNYVNRMDSAAVDKLLFGEPASALTLNQARNILALPRIRDASAESFKKTNLMGAAGLLAALAITGGGERINSYTPDLNLPPMPSFPSLKIDLPSLSSDTSPALTGASESIQIKTAEPPTPPSSAQITETPFGGNNSALENVPVIKQEMEQQENIHKDTVTAAEASLESEMAISQPEQPHTAENAPIAWSANEITPYDDNGEIQTWPNHHLPGVINLLEKDHKTGEWIHYNNIVPVVTAGGIRVNAEMDKTVAVKSVIHNPDGTSFARYQYPSMRNGAHFYLDVHMEPGKKEVNISLGINEGSAKIDEIAMGNFLGIAKSVRYVKFGDTVIDAAAYPDPGDGHFKTGRFEPFELNGNNRIEFWGPDGVKQYQIVNSGNTYLELEFRRRAWMEHMDQQAAAIVDENGNRINWTELVGTYIRNPKNGATWTIGIEKTHQASQE